MTPPVGSFGLITVKGRTGLIVRAGQVLLGRRPTGTHYGHVFGVVSDEQTVHGSPDGAFMEDLGYYIGDGSDAASTCFVDVAMTDEQRDEFALFLATELVGAPYAGWRGYLYLALRRLGFPAFRLADALTRDGAYLCSALLTLAYRHAGVDMFPGRSIHDITPGDFARLAVTDPRCTVLKESE